MERIYNFYLDYKNWIIGVVSSILVLFFILPFICTNRVGRDEECISKEDVALYIINYHELPKNYVTKYGYNTGQNHGDVNDKIIGGDTHWNNGQLESFNVSIDASLKECDIAGNAYTPSKYRGTERLVYTTNEANVRVFYTADHYTSFIEITGFQLQLTRNILWIVFSILALITVGGVLSLAYYSKKRHSNELRLKAPSDDDIIDLR